LPDVLALGIIALVLLGFLLLGFWLLQAEVMLACVECTLMPGHKIPTR
jgi:hypothetical protein